MPLSSSLGAPAALSGQNLSQKTPLVIPPLVGQVYFTSTRTTQALMSDVADKATVSLIDTSLDQTMAAGVTTPTGAFDIQFQNGFTPNPAVTYYLEAVKGLNNNAPTSSVARVRTLIQFKNGSWQSITGGTITIDPSTTALSIGAALRNGNPGPFNFASLIGSVSTGTTETYAPVSGLSASDYSALLALVNNSLAGNTDPVAQIALDTANNSWNAITLATLSLFSFGPASGSVGTAVTASGAGFSTTAADDTVKFNGAAATVTSANSTTLSLTVPSGATSGQTSVQVGTIIALGPLFTVPPVLTSMSPASASAGTSVTLTGTGFDTAALTNNVVSFSGVSGQVTAASATSLTASVPTGAISGPLSVTVDGTTTIASTSFTVPVVLSSFTPTSGGPGASVTVTGTGFSATAASDSVTIGGSAATVTSASATSLTVTAPSQ
ncbi:MAG: IPT/TIG domain-containing protein, partial [Cyanobacteria bacterium REEB65]|nr:IPT/TIG domain-containing protein [Cyanobacteria bacterium REEB65]